MVPYLNGPGGDFSEEFIYVRRPNRSRTFGISKIRVIILITPPVRQLCDRWRRRTGFRTTINRNDFHEHLTLYAREHVDSTNRHPGFTGFRPVAGGGGYNGAIPFPLPPIIEGTKNE